jgi:hypothetical protein
MLKRVGGFLFREGNQSPGHQTMCVCVSVALHTPTGQKTESEGEAFTDTSPCLLDVISISAQS